MAKKSEEISLKQKSKPRVISIISQKGGVGKTTLTTNLADGLSRKGYKVLVIDLDPSQGNLTTSFIGPIWDEAKSEQRKGIHSLYSKKSKLPNVCYKTGKENIWIVPSEDKIAIENLMSDDFLGFIMLLKEEMDQFPRMGQYFDFVLIDNLPSQGKTSTAGLAASDYFLMPTTLEDLAVFGISSTYSQAEKVKSVNPKLRPLGIVINRFDARTTASKTTLEDVKVIADEAGVKVFETLIPSVSKFGSLPRMQASIFDVCTPKEKGRKEYTLLTDEIIKELYQIEEAETKQERRPEMSL